MTKGERLRLKKFAIKSEVKTSLTECLELLPLEELKKIGEEYELAEVENSEKAELVPLIFKAITDKFLNNYIYFTDFQEEGFNNIVENKIVEDVDVFYAIYYLLYYSGIAYYFYNNDKLYLTIPTEIVDIYKNANLIELNKVKAKNQEIHKYMMALCNLYGIYDSKQFVKVFNAYHEEKLSESDFVKYAVIMNFKQSYFSVDNEEDNNCLVFVGEDEEGELFDMLFDNMNRPYYMPSKEEIDFFADEPFQDTEQYKRFEKYVVDNKLVEKKKMEDFLYEIRSDCQDDKHPSQILETVTRYGISFEDIDEANILMGLIMDMCNHERKWVLKGYSPAMLQESINKSKVIEFPKIGRNQFCHCGSGKKYKKCCGKERMEQ